MSRFNVSFFISYFLLCTVCVADGMNLFSCCAGGYSEVVEENKDMPPENKPQEIELKDKEELMIESYLNGSLFRAPFIPFPLDNTQLLSDLLASSGFKFNQHRIGWNVLLEGVVGSRRSQDGFEKPYFGTVLRILLNNGANPLLIRKEVNVVGPWGTRTEVTKAWQELPLLSSADRILIEIASFAHSSTMSKTEIDEILAPKLKMMKFQGTDEEYDQLQHDMQLLDIGLCYYHERLDLLSKKEKDLAHEKFRSNMNVYPGNSNSFKKTAPMLLALRKRCHDGLYKDVGFQFQE